MEEEFQSPGQRKPKLIQATKTDVVETLAERISQILIANDPTCTHQTREQRISNMVHELIICQGWLDIQSLSVIATVSTRTRRLSKRPSSLGKTIDLRRVSRNLTDASLASIFAQSGVLSSVRWLCMNRGDDISVLGIKRIFRAVNHVENFLTGSTFGANAFHLLQTHSRFLHVQRQHHNTRIVYSYLKNLLTLDAKWLAETLKSTLETSVNGTVRVSVMVDEPVLDLVCKAVRSLFSEETECALVATEAPHFRCNSLVFQTHVPISVYCQRCVNFQARPFIVHVKVGKISLHLYCYSHW